MYVCIYVWICVHIYTSYLKAVMSCFPFVKRVELSCVKVHMYVNIYTHVYRHTCFHIYVYEYIQMYPDIHVFTHMYVSTYTCTDVLGE